MSRTGSGHLNFFIRVAAIAGGLTLIGRHNVVGLAYLAGDVVLGPGSGVISFIQTTHAGATRREYAARQVQLDLYAPSLYHSTM